MAALTAAAYKPSIAIEQATSSYYLDFSLLLPDVMTIADEVDAQFDAVDGQLHEAHAQVDGSLVFALSSSIWCRFTVP
jgi:hypothetical protein